MEYHKFGKNFTESESIPIHYKQIKKSKARSTHKLKAKKVRIETLRHRLEGKSENLQKKHKV